MKLELARAGSFNGIEITPEDLLSMAQTFVSDVPVTIGHETDDSMPACGWVKSVEVSADGTVLTGTIELGDELAEAFAEGKYKNWSIGAARDDTDALYLHHVAFLGAVPPMIKGLKVIEMGDRSKIVTIASVGMGFIMSDGELAEYSKLKSEKAKRSLNALKEAVDGKLPFKTNQELIRFADSLERRHPELGVAAFLSDIFRSVRMPVADIQTERTKAPGFARGMFSKI